MLSSDAVAIKEPSGEKAIAFTGMVCPVIVPRCDPVTESQIRTVVSLDAVAIREPSGEKATSRTAPLCPLSVVRWAPVAASHMHAV